MSKQLYFKQSNSAYKNSSISNNLVMVWFDLVWFVRFYGISTFVCYLTPNKFLC